MDKRFESHEPPESDEVGKLLRSLDDDTVSLNKDQRDAAMNAARDVFAQQSDPSVSQESPAGKRTMFTKVFVAFAAIAAGLALVFFNFLGGTNDGATLGAILDKVTASDTLHLRVVREGKETQVWVRSATHVRWEETPQQYQIAVGSRWWQVDEQTNTVTDGNSPWFRNENVQVDLLSMLGIDDEHTSAVREVKRTGQSTFNGKRCHVFRFSAKSEQKPLLLEALADAENGELYRIAAWLHDKRGAVPDVGLTLVARDAPVDESKFVVATSLSQDGRIGKIVDSQGIVTLRPLSSKRWTPVSRQMTVQPADWLRTDVRGANAAKITLTSDYELVVGPGSLIELQGTHRVRLHGGEVKVVGGEDAEAALTLVGAGDASQTVQPGETVHYELNRKNELATVDAAPKWLLGFEGASTNESIGSLVCNIDGRSVPLTVGYHKVTVEIRDQIARTMIEESFVNHTGQRLEGTFHFPLPQDASISGFGMWINDELIEADVVEKQRAREIYETILSERRDPGLLEWSGGNLFKARVFPINPHSEKRIRIVYTQVLPMRANQYRYSYGLRSEMLRKTPLRELSVDVHVHSALPLKEVKCTTHTARSQVTTHSARLEFAAQEYTPTHDFEVVCEVDSQQSDVVVIPHQRGDDGYFLVQMKPPSTDGNWQREILPDGQPLKLLLVCDTSASMDSEKRALQQQFVRSVLAALGPKDRFNVAVADVDCQWLHESSVEATQASIDETLDQLASRISLGWTDLDQMTPVGREPHGKGNARHLYRRWHCHGTRR